MCYQRVLSPSRPKQGEWEGHPSTLLILIKKLEENTWLNWLFLIMIIAESFTEIEPLHWIFRREERQTAKHLIQSLGSDILGSPFSFRSPSGAAAQNGSEEYYFWS